jgi:hypothetical protein
MYEGELYCEIWITLYNLSPRNVIKIKYIEIIIIIIIIMLLLVHVTKRSH